MTTLNDFIVTDDVTDVLAAHINVLQANALRAEYHNTETITATKELADSDTAIQVITPSGANRDVELAPEASDNHLTLIINPSASTYNVLIKDDSGASTYAVLRPGNLAMCYPDGTSWRVDATRFGLGLIRGNGGTLTIASGVITPTHTYHQVDTEGAAASDDVTTIAATYAAAGDVLVLQSVNAGRDPTFKHGTANIFNKSLGDVTLTGVNSIIAFALGVGTSNWTEI